MNNVNHVRFIISIILCQIYEYNMMNVQMTTSNSNSKMRQMCEKHHKKIILSSLLFLIPLFYAIHHNMYHHIGMIGLTIIISVMFWINPIHSWRRILDLSYQTSIFILFFISGLIFINDIFFMCLFLFCVFLSTFAFYNSNHAERNNQENWWIYHFSFHLLACIGCLIVLFFIPKPTIRNMHEKTHENI